MDVSSCHNSSIAPLIYYTTIFFSFPLQAFILFCFVMIFIFLGFLYGQSLSARDPYKENPGVSRATPREIA